MNREGRLWVRLISRQAFRQYMQFRGETNRSLAVKAGISSAMVGHLRGGHRSTCSPETATALEKALNAPPGSLFLAELPHATSSAMRSA